MEIYIEEYVLERGTSSLMGDKLDCSQFVVVVSSSKGRTNLRTYDQYNKFHCSVKTSRQQCLNKAQRKALKLAKVIDCPCEIQPVLKGS